MVADTERAEIVAAFCDAYQKAERDLPTLSAREGAALRGVVPRDATVARKVAGLVDLRWPGLATAALYAALTAGEETAVDAPAGDDAPAA